MTFVSQEYRIFRLHLLDSNLIMCRRKSPSMHFMHEVDSGIRDSEKVKFVTFSKYRCVSNDYQFKIKIVHQEEGLGANLTAILWTHTFVFGGEHY